MQNFTLRMSTVYRAASLPRILRKYKIKAPAEPWMHAVYYRGTLVYFVWDTREIVFVYEFDEKIAPVFYGELAIKGLIARDSKLPLVDSGGLLKKLNDERIMRLIEE